MSAMLTNNTTVLIFFFAFETSAVYEIQPFFLTLLGFKKLQCVLEGV